MVPAVLKVNSFNKRRLKVSVAMFGCLTERACVVTLAVVSLSITGFYMTWKSLLRCLVQVTVWLMGVVTLSCIKSTLRIPCMELQPSNAATVAGVLREDAVFLARNCSSRVEPQVLNCTVVEVETLWFFDTKKKICTRLIEFASRFQKRFYHGSRTIPKGFRTVHWAATCRNIAGT